LDYKLEKLTFSPKINSLKVLIYPNLIELLGFYLIDCLIVDFVKINAI